MTGPTIKTRSGLYFDFVNPTLDMINLEDISHSLSHICRFGGHCRKFYSVAQHLIECVKYAENHLQCSFQDLKDIFCHDFVEAYVGDVCKPLKNLLPQYSEIENRVEFLVAKRFDVRLGNPIIKKVDLTLLFAERDCLFDPDELKWNQETNTESYKMDLVLTDIATTRKSFLSLAERLNIT